MRYLVTGGILLATIGWLVLSYLPGVTAVLPKAAFDGALAQAVLPWLAGISLLAFFAIQLDLVGATARWFRPSVPAEVALARGDFNLTRGRELFWTVLPLLGTVLLGGWWWSVR